MSDAPAPPSYVARSADPRGARDTVLAIWRGNLGDATRMASKYDWFYLGCPWGTPLLQLLTQQPSGADVGVAAAGPRRLLRDGREIVAGVLVDLAVAPEHRSLGPALILQQSLIAAAEPRFELLYGFPNPKAASVFKRAGYVHLTDRQRHVRVLCHADYLARRMPRLLARGVGAVVDVLFAIRDRARARRDTPLRDAWHDRVDPQMDALWQRSRPTHGVAAIRDNAFLAWRFDGAPLARTRYLLLHEPRGGELVAWFACEVQDRALYVRDFWSAAGLAGIERACVDALLRAARRDRHASVSMELAGPAARFEGWRGAGFVERGRRPVFGRWSAAPGQVPGASDLHLTAADEDE